MKKAIKRMFVRLSKLHKRYGDVIGSERQEARKYYKIFKRKKK